MWRPFGFNLTYLLAVAWAGDGTRGVAMARDLLNAKANPHAIMDTGENCLATVASQNPNFAPNMLRLFVAYSADVNSPMIAGSLLFRILYLVSHVAVRCGSQNDIFVEFSKLGPGAVPLTGAAVSGKVAEIRELLAMHADPSIANRHGFLVWETS